MEISDLLNREFTVTVIKMLIIVRKTMHEQVRISTVTEHRKRYQTNCKPEEYNNSIENFNKGVPQLTRASGKRTSELEDRAVVSIQSEDQKKKNEKSKDSLRDLQNTITQKNIRITEASEGEEREGQKAYQRNNG